MGFFDELYHELAVGNQAKQVLSELYMTRMHEAEDEQNCVAREHQNRTHMRHGVKTAAIHARFYHYWGQRLGYECWDDQQFLREFLRDNENCRVRSKGRKILIGWGPAARYLDRKRAENPALILQESSGKKFHKNYGCF